MRGGTRGAVLQLVVLAAVVLFIAGIAHNIANNLLRLGVRTGFNFLSRPAGFDISQTLIPFTETASYFTVFVVALLNTLLVTLLSIMLATLLGFVIALARSSSNAMVAAAGTFYVETFRNIPLLIQLLFWYFAVMQALPLPRASLQIAGLVFLNNRGLFLPSIHVGSVGPILVGFVTGLVVATVMVWAAKRRRTVTGKEPGFGWLALVPPVILPVAAGLIAGDGLALNAPHLQGFNFHGGLAILPELLALTLGLSIYSAAFIAEIMRAGIQATSRGQIDAAGSLGLTRWQTTRLIVVPLALRMIVPPLGAYYGIMLKNSTLGSAIAYPDLILVFAGTVLNQTGQPIEVMTITLTTFLALGFALSLATSAANRQVLR
jgi:general L-amino acid transport system permease protein